jgi:sialic acid synthase SpsE
MNIEIIAEIGQNHNGDMMLAKEMIHAAKDAGADTAKFQAFDAKTTFPPPSENEWYDYNCSTELTFEQLENLAEECTKVGIEFMASAFDVERVRWLEEIGVKRHKLASRSIRDKELITALQDTRKQLLISLGMWSGNKFPEVSSEGGVKFLYCVSKYPTSLTDIHLGGVDFISYAGFSDHTIGVVAPLVAMSRGAKIIEKHFTLDKDAYGPDHSCSMDVEELRAIVEYRNEICSCLT